MNEFRDVLAALSAEGVEFILAGGLAAVAHGSVRLTRDIDVVYRRTESNLARLQRALACHRPYLRGAPPDLPFSWDVRTIKAGLNFRLTTELGFVDLLGEISGGGSYDDLLAGAQQIEVFGVSCLVLNLRQLIQSKRAAGRPKDFEAIAELESILEEQNPQP